MNTSTHLTTAERRFKMVRIASDLMLHSFLDEGQTPRCVIKGMPSGWFAHRVGYDPLQDVFMIIIGHPSFLPVLPADIIPDLEGVTYTAVEWRPGNK